MRTSPNVDRGDDQSLKSIGHSWRGGLRSARASSFASMPRQLIRRFHPAAYTPREAYVRATETPREVRQLGEAVVTWALANVRRDRESTLGSLPEQFGFRLAARGVLASRGELYVFALNNHMSVFVGDDALWCAST